MARVKKIQAKQQYSAAEAAEILGVCKHSIYRMIDAGRLQAAKVGSAACSHYRISRASIEALLGEPIAAPVMVEEQEPAQEPAAQQPALRKEALGGQETAPGATPAPAKLDDVLAAIDTLHRAATRAIHNPRYSLVRPRIEALLDRICSAALELRRVYGRTAALEPGADAQEQAQEQPAATPAEGG